MEPAEPSPELLRSLGETREQFLERLRNAPLHLCRLRYFGNQEKWSMAFYTYSRERYEPCMFAKYVAQGRVEGCTEGLTEGLTRGLTKGLTEGLARGRTEEAARAVLTVLRVRGLGVPDTVRERILAEKDPERLERWLEKAAVATSVAAVLDEPN